MSLSRTTTYLRTEPCLCWHIDSGTIDVRGGRLTRMALCGRPMRRSWPLEVVSDGTVPEPVCATCARVARS